MHIDIDKDIFVKFNTRAIVVVDHSGKASNARMAAIARGQVRGERLELTLDSRNELTGMHARAYARPDNIDVVDGAGA